MTLTLGWFSTGRGPGSRGLLDFVQKSIRYGDARADIAFVFSNREDGESEETDLFFDLIRQCDIPLVNLSYKRFVQGFSGPKSARRLEFDRKVMNLLEGYHPNICILGGYMLIVGAEMIERYTMLNLHPALPNGPIGKWQEVIWKLIETRADQTGAMIHVALEEVDRGPVVTYSSVSLRGEQFEREWIQATQLTVEQLKEQYGETLPLFRHIREEEYKLEPYLLTETIKAIASRDIVIQDHKVLDRRGNPTPGVCLNSFINPI